MQHEGTAADSSRGEGRIILYVAMSLDGYIAGDRGDISWLDSYHNVDYGYERFMRSIGAVIMGSHTYEILPSLGAWPYGERKTFVVTKRKLKKIAAADVRHTNEPLQKVVLEAKAAAKERDVYLVGGGELVTSFLAEGLIDEMILFMIPVLLGGGVRLFVTSPLPRPLILNDVFSYPNHVVRLHYRRG